MYLNFFQNGKSKDECQGLPPSSGDCTDPGYEGKIPAPWAQVSAEMRKQWKIVVQEVEKPRLHQALKAKRDEAVCILWGIVLGCGWQVDELVNKKSVL